MEKFEPEKIGNLKPSTPEDWEITDEDFEKITRSSFVMNRKTKQFINADAP